MKLDFADFEMMDIFVLGHMTSTALLDEVRMHGLLPRANEGREIVKDDGLRSDLGAVYLCTRIDRLYFDRAKKRYGGEGLLVLVEVERNRLEPDENAITPGLSLERALFESMRFGQCKYRGQIPLSNIRGFYTEDGRRLVGEGGAGVLEAKG